MADEGDEVERDAGPFQCRAIAFEIGKNLLPRGLAQKPAEMAAQEIDRMRRGGIERKTAIADDDGGHALQRLLGPFPLAQEGEVVMAMGVDEARCQETVGGIQDQGPLGAEHGTHGADAAARQADIATEPGRAGAVQDACILDDEILGHAETPFAAGEPIRPRYLRPCCTASRLGRLPMTVFPQMRPEAS